MKSLFLVSIVLALGAGPVAFADDVEDGIRLAKEAFNQDKAVKEAIDNLKLSQHSSVADPTTAIVGGGCGVAGCDISFLVTQAFERPETNPQMKVVAGTVTVNVTNDTAYAVKLLGEQIIHTED